MPDSALEGNRCRHGPFLIGPGEGRDEYEDRRASRFGKTV
jgi:hypothetical protein